VRAGVSEPVFYGNEPTGWLAVALAGHRDGIFSPAARGRIRRFSKYS
jgi:hypothetical protein